LTAEHENEHLQNRFSEKETKSILRLLTIVDTDIQYKDAKSELRPVTENQHSTHISISLTAALHTWMDHLSRAPKTSTQSHSVSRTCALLPAAAGFTWSLVITYTVVREAVSSDVMASWVGYTTQITLADSAVESGTDTGK
jgi:hypothetical protein